MVGLVAAVGRLRRHQSRDLYASHAHTSLRPLESLWERSSELVGTSKAWHWTLGVAVSHVRTRSVAIAVGVLGLLASPVLVTPSASADPLSATVSATPLTASLVRTVATSTLSPPIPDPSGITYIPSRDRLLIADGEVDEMPIFQGSNLFEITRAGALQDRGVTQPPVEGAGRREPHVEQQSPARRR